MENEERPNKMRKLDHEDNNQEPSQQEEKPSEEKSTEANQSEANLPASEEPPQETSKSDPVKELPSSSNGTAPPQQPPTSITGDLDTSTLSKNQLKKLQKRQAWEAGRDSRKLLRKEKQKEKRERVRAEKASLPPSSLPTKPKYRPTPKQLPVTFLIDCDFDDLMREGERLSLSSQITRCYSDNKNSAFRAHLTLASFGGKLRERYEGILEGQYRLWKGFRTFGEGFGEVAEMAKGWMKEGEGNALAGVFEKYAEEDQAKLQAAGEIVYLSAEADSDLEELKPYSTYIIGGLVDKNREKGICHKRATAAGIKTKRLPIGKFMEMSSRKVLATNHAHEIMVRWLECGDWGEAFVKVIPKRKGGMLKGAEGKKGRGENGEGDGEDGGENGEGEDGGEDGEDGDAEHGEDGHGGEGAEEDAEDGAVVDEDHGDKEVEGEDA